VAGKAAFICKRVKKGQEESRESDQRDIKREIKRDQQGQQGQECRFTLQLIVSQVVQYISKRFSVVACVGCRESA
jgi:hypothetical protein